jgi:hypothetical protein
MPIIGHSLLVTAHHALTARPYPRRVDADRGSGVTLAVLSAGKPRAYIAVKVIERRP